MKLPMLVAAGQCLARFKPLTVIPSGDLLFAWAEINTRQCIAMPDLRSSRSDATVAIGKGLNLRLRFSKRESRQPFFVSSRDEDLARLAGIIQPGAMPIGPAW